MNVVLQIIDSGRERAEMTGEEFKAAIGELGYSQASFSKKYGFGLRTVGLWADRGPPPYVIAILGDLFSLQVAAPGPARTPAEADAALLHVLAGSAREAERAGWTPDEIADAAKRYWSDYRSANRDRDELVKPAINLARTA